MKKKIIYVILNMKKKKKKKKKIVLAEEYMQGRQTRYCNSPYHLLSAQQLISFFAVPHFYECDARDM